MEFSGITFFDFNYALQEFLGSVTVSSNDDKKWLAFDDKKDTRWNSSGEDTDGDAISVERDFEVNRNIIAIFIYNTNISNISFEYYDGSWHNITTGGGGNATITKSADNKYIYVLLNTKTSMSRIRITGSNTITANEEKSIYGIYAFDLIGTFTYPVAPNPSRRPNQIIQQREDSKNQVISKGFDWRFNLRFRSHTQQNDIDLYNTLANREKEFYIWINGGSEAQFTYKFEPYRFGDIYKVSNVDAINPSLTNNLYWTGLNDNLRLIEN